MITFLSLLYTGQAGTKDLVKCFATRSCVGRSVTTSLDTCCQSQVDPFGLAYTVGSQQVCILCPVCKFLIISYI